jgi:hypothetical protein
MGKQVRGFENGGDQPMAAMFGPRIAVAGHPWP